MVSRTWRGEPAPGGSLRGAGSAILYLLEDGQVSRWHRIDATELWLHQGGAALTLGVWEGGGLIETRLGPDLLGGDRPQAVVPTGVWQTAQAYGGWVLSACVVVPAFEFSAFEMAPLGWRPG